MRGTRQRVYGNYILTPWMKRWVYMRNNGVRRASSCFFKVLLYRSMIHWITAEKAKTKLISLISMLMLNTSTLIFLTTSIITRIVKLISKIWKDKTYHVVKVFFVEVANFYQEVVHFYFEYQGVFIYDYWYDRHLF